MIYIIIIIFLLLFIFYSFIINKKYNKRIEDIKNEKIKIISQDLEKVKFQKDTKETELKEIEGKIQNELQKLNELASTRELTLKTTLENEQQRINLEIENMHRAADHEMSLFKEAQEAEKENILEEVEKIKTLLKENQVKIHSINELNRTKCEAADYIKAHSISISPEARQDIEFLVSIEKQFNNKEIIHKLIWSDYLQAPFKEMIKRIFGNTSPKNVIYCIEDIDSGKKYIGKTAGAAADRWTNHIKGSLNIGTISHQKVHEEMFGRWDRFCFNIIEEVEGDLGEREKFYIAHYETDKYGLNMKAGG